ncbi:hypothetical protein AK830_g132 [Neonectria ditissima]|uniref:Heterokaryon incompatibility domain-containing protein n=1 Tax=Neonectria ditissima TaxID=78410 RepID=A0A0P7BWI9_9HYPO|nr:hypothetical protein AK830_g132 [Neonectria ditissima]
MTSEDSHPLPEPRTLLVYSSKPPDEASVFGLRGSDIEDIRPAPESGPPASPDDWGFTSPTTDGICKYCQLMLHPDAPKLIEHQPNLQRLIDLGETCSICKWLEVSIQKGSSWLVSRYSQGDPELCDENSTARPVTVELTKHPKYTMAVGCVGSRKVYVNCGAPLTITTPSRLGKIPFEFYEIHLTPEIGDLATRRFWIPHDELDQTEPFKRMDILKTWLSECANHETCSASHQMTRHTKLPTRVLDLTGSLDVPLKSDDITIKLRETQEGEMGTYTALSYCWGADPELHFKTTSDVLQAYQQGIDISSLPLTHKEAILTTLYLGIRYLWIDSICIVQDSHHDWEAELAKMGSVYSNAHLTLAATSSDTPGKGLLLPFQGAICVKVHGESTIVRMQTHRTIDKASEPLNTRGWALQEAVLSSRLVCFGEEQWLWKCPNRYATEDGLIDGPRFIDNGLIQWADLVNQDPGEDGKSHLRHWYQMVTNYSNRNLTYQSDKRNAIAGLTDMFAKHTGYQYLAGLWAEDLANGLMWEATSRGVIREPGSIPSWSWLSVKGAIKGYGYKSPTVSMIELLEVDQQWEGVPLASPLKVARLTVRGPMLQATLGKRSVTQESRHHIIAAPESEEIFGEAFLDSRLPPDHEMSTISCLFVLEVPEETEHFVLLLVPADSNENGDENTYKRLGFGVIWKKSRFYKDRDQGNGTLSKASSDTVVLV